MSLLDHPQTLSVTQAAQRGVAGIIADAEHNNDIIVTRRNEPIAVVISIQRIEVIEEIIEDLRDLTLAMSRVITDKRPPIPFEDVLAAYGLRREELDTIEPDETSLLLP